MRSTLTAGIALASAGAIALSPISPVAPRLADAQVSVIHASSAAVELTALTDPITAWLEVFGTSFNNVSQIGGAIAAAPFPILQQVISNQIANGQLLFTSIDAAAMSYIRFFTSAEDYQLGYWVREAANNLSSGNISGAAANLSTVLFRLFAFANPLINMMQIPIGMSQNLVNVFAAVPQMLMPLGLSVLNPIEGVINASGDVAQSVLNAINDGDPVGALNAVINAPAVLTGAILNGYYNDVAGLTTGLFTTGASMLSRGLIETLLVTIPQMVATALGWQAPTAVNQVSGNVVDETPAVKTDAETGSAEALPAVHRNALSSIADTSAAMTNAVKAVTASFDPQSEATATTTTGGPSEVDGAGADVGEAGTVTEEEAPETETPASDVVDSTDETEGSEQSNGTKPSPNGSTDLSGGNKAVPGKTGSDTNAGSGSGSGSVSTGESASPTTNNNNSGTGSTGNTAGTGSSTNDSGNDAGGSNDGSDSGSDS